LSGDGWTFARTVLAAWIVAGALAAAMLGIISCVDEGGAAPELERPSMRWGPPRAAQTSPEEEERNRLLAPLDPRSELVAPLAAISS
jgi:hypothetical protein